MLSKHLVVILTTHLVVILSEPSAVKLTIDLVVMLNEPSGEQVESKYGHKVLPGTKSGLRLLLACRRLRELLSTTPTAGTTVEVRGNER